jgi:hypothetical protein
MNFSTSPVTIDETQKIMKQMTNCICKINTGRIYGTAFFCKVRFVDNSSLNVLMTSYSLIDENYLKENKEINLLLNDNSTKIIILDKKRKIYTDKNYNLTLIELRNKDNINDFFHIDDYLLSEEKHKNFYENKQIYILHYLNMGKPSVSYGFLTELNDSEIKHTCLIKSGSFGSPILNFSNNKIIGISKEQNENLNLGTFLRLPIKEFKNLIDNPKKSEAINNLKGNNINNSLLNSATFNNNILMEDNLKTEKPKIMIVFKTVKVSYPITVEFGTTIEELLRNFLKKVKRKKYIDIENSKIGFLFNSVRLNKNQKVLQNVVEKYFNNRRLPTIIVTHL